MNTPMRIAVAAAAVLVVAVLGLNFIPRNSGVGGPPVTASPNPSPTPSPSPTASPTPSPSPRANGGSLRSPQDMNISLAPGTYKVADPFALPFAITVSKPWTLKALAPGDVGFAKPHPSDPGSTTAWINVALVEGTYKDPCHRHVFGGGMVTATVDATVSAITHMVGFHAGPVSDVTVGGFPGKHFELTNALDATTCTDGVLKLWTTNGGVPLPGSEPGGATYEFWIVAHDDWTPVTIVGETFQDTPAGSRHEIAAAVNTITFQP